MDANDKLIEALSRIAAALEAMPKPAPDYWRDLADYWKFDWTTIGATVVAEDKHGATVVSWGGCSFTRRCPPNKYGVAIWYSRPIGKSGEETQYEHLITFKHADGVDPLPQKAVLELKAAIALRKQG